MAMDKHRVSRDYLPPLYHNGRSYPVEGAFRLCLAVSSLQIFYKSPYVLRGCQAVIDYAFTGLNAEKLVTGTALEN